MTVNADLATTKAEWDRASDGIVRPEICTLAAGEAIFRFASTRHLGRDKPTDSSTWAKGAWWVRERDYHRVLVRYQSGNLGFGTVARSALAVQPSWSLMDVSVKAYVEEDILCYSGLGKTQYHDVLPNGMKVTLAGWPDITQLYLPGMRTGTLDALRIVRKKIITTDNWGHGPGAKG
ncbi:MAG: hypothetical protein AAFU85_22410 [Planctomycetota bacterium]